jgi:biopolymer transport protein ExbD
MRLDANVRPSGEDRLELTPLIDVVFLLLVFFLAATTFARDEVDMDLELPESSSGEASERPHPIVIQVLSDGALTVDGRVVTIEALHQKLRAAAVRDKDQEVLIRGDTRVRFGAVAQAFDACLAASLKRVSIAAQPASSPAPTERPR